MNTFAKLLATTLLSLIAAATAAQTADPEDVEELKTAALEALIFAPPERALPIIRKVLASDSSDEVKERALFVLSQIELPEAQALLLEAAVEGSGEYQEEAIRMIGIGGDKNALAQLVDVYRNGDEEIRDAVLEAYLIADDVDAVYQIALAADNEDDYEEAVETLGAMDARDQLRELRNTRGVTESLIEAYIIAEDHETLRELAMDGSDAEMQAEAIEALGIVNGPNTGPTLVEIYRNTGNPDIREAAVQGLHIADDDASMLELYRLTDDPVEKKRLLEYLVMMDSDAVWDLIDSALEEQR